MNLWDKIVKSSGLPECRSVAEHLCSSSGSTVNICGVLDNRLLVKPTLITNLMGKPILNIKIIGKPILKNKIICAKEK